MPKIYTQESFIAKCREMNDNLYDYSNTVYKGSSQKIEVYCPKHDETFYPRADNHIGGKRGCSKCRSEALNKANKMTLDEFVTKANTKHNNKYDYSLVKEFTNQYDKVDIICPKHGVFSQEISSHLSGSGCKKCAYERK